MFLRYCTLSSKTTFINIAQKANSCKRYSSPSLAQLSHPSRILLYFPDFDVGGSVDGTSATALVVSFESYKAGTNLDNPSPFTRIP